MSTTCKLVFVKILVFLAGIGVPTKLIYKLVLVEGLVFLQNKSRELVLPSSWW